MERLTLDEAIKCTKEIARANRVEAENYILTTGPYYNANLECANQYEQFSMWLKELKSYKDAEEQGLLVRLPCKVGATVWELCLCDDGNYKIFPMTVKTISEYGTLRQVKKRHNHLEYLCRERLYVHV